MHSISHEICTLFCWFLFDYGYSIYSWGFHTLKWKDHQGDCPGLHRRHWRQASMCPVNTRAVTLNTFSFLCMIHLDIFFRVTSMVLGLSQDWLSATAATLKDIGKIDWYQTATKRNEAQTMCIKFLRCAVYHHLGPYYYRTQNNILISTYFPSVYWQDISLWI